MLPAWLRRNYSYIDYYQDVLIFEILLHDGSNFILSMSGLVCVINHSPPSLSFSLTLEKVAKSD